MTSLYLKAMRLPAIGAMWGMILGLTGCSDTLEVPADELYTRGFIKEFGVPDSSHDWTMATTVSATMSDGFAPGTTNVKIFSDFPESGKAVLMADFDMGARSGGSDLKFNAPKGTNFVYAVAFDGPVEIARGWAQIIDGKVALGADARRAADASGVSLTPRGDVVMKRMPDDMINKLYDMPDPDGKLSYTNTQTPALPDWWYYANEPFISEAVPELYVVNGIDIDTSENAPQFSVQEARRLFDYYLDEDGTQQDGVFRERQDNIKKYVESGVLNTDIIFKTAEAGEVELNCIWRGVGSQADYFGYYYYTSENEEMLHPLALWNDTPKFILIGNSDNHKENIISGKSSLTQRSRYQLDEEGNITEALNWENNEGLTGEWIFDELHKLEAGETADRTVHEDDMLRGATIKVPYFGPDGKGAPSYDWPKGVRIGFFMFSTTTTSSGSYMLPADRKFFVSNCINNYYLFNHLYGEPNPWSDTVWGSYAALKDGKHARPYCAHFKYNGRDYLAMADGGNDFDLNDLVFRVSNLERDTKDFTDDVPPVDPQPQSWIIACEDLGNTDDYDFNDIVLEVSYVSGHTEATVTPLACGGELSSEIYYDGDYLGEIHMLSDVNYGVIAGTGRAPMGANPQSVKIKVPADWDINEGIKKFTIRTLNPTTNAPTGQWITAPNTDAGSSLWNVPQMLLLPSDWRWPLERTHITEAYPGFKAWVGDAHYTGWNATRVDSRVYKR